MKPTSNEREQLERARGTWELVVTIDPSDEARFDKLRRALRFPRSDAEILRRMLPGPVRRGARSDLLVILEKLRSAGWDAEVRRSTRES